MSSRLIEAKFRALDEVIEGMYKSKRVAPEAFRKDLSLQKNTLLGRLPNTMSSSHTRIDHQRPERPKSSASTRQDKSVIGIQTSPSTPSARKLPKRCASAGQTKPMRNWFAPSCNNPPTKRPPVDIETPKTLLQAFHLPVPSNPTTVLYDKPRSDASFYYFEIRLDHPRKLQGWLFHGRFTDISDPNRPTVELWNLEVDEYNFVLFHDGILTQKYFDPFRYFTHIKECEQLYHHQLHVELFSTSPVRHRVVDTIVAFTHQKDIHSPRKDFGQITTESRPNRYEADRNQDSLIDITKEEEQSVDKCVANVKSVRASHRSVKKSTPFSIDEAKMELGKMRESIKQSLMDERNRIQRDPEAQLWRIDSVKMENQIVEMTEAEHAQHHIQMEQQLKTFWTKQLAQMEQLEVGSEQDFKNHNDLPLARIKRIMKSDEDVRMISAEAPVLFAKACEMFILELTLRSWSYSERNKRRTLQKEDIQTAIRNTDIFDFLVDVIN